MRKITTQFINQGRVLMWMRLLIAKQMGEVTMTISNGGGSLTPVIFLGIFVFSFLAFFVLLVLNFMLIAVRCLCVLLLHLSSQQEEHVGCVNFDFFTNLGISATK